jgi:hypothetical protein
MKTAIHFRRIGVIHAVVMAIVLLQVGAAWARGPWRASGENTFGWQFMSPEERIAHQTRIRGFVSLEECRKYQVSHHRLMEERAREQGVAPPGGGRDFCEHLKSGKSVP